ncbi:MAG TPA: hypothetical protein VN030_13015 [Cellvibrio sp.]|nr:hypothetical protein [Cellvibrio sp.]
MSRDNDQNTSAKWWQTLPGVLTAITATITAVAGLIAVLHQTGWLPSPTQAPAASITAAAPDTARPNTGTAPSTQPVSIELPAGMQVKLPNGEGHFVYTILQARLEAYNSENRSLKFTIRGFNDYTYPANFWDRSFRLLIDGSPLAPVSNLNEVVDAQSAKEGEIAFTIPVDTQQVILKIGDPGQASTQIPFQLSEPK